MKETVKKEGKDGRGSGRRTRRRGQVYKREEKGGRIRKRGREEGELGGGRGQEGMPFFCQLPKYPIL